MGLDDAVQEGAAFNTLNVPILRLLDRRVQVLSAFLRRRYAAQDEDFLDVVEFGVRDAYACTGSDPCSKNRDGAAALQYARGGHKRDFGLASIEQTVIVTMMMEDAVRDTDLVKIGQAIREAVTVRRDLDAALNAILRDSYLAYPNSLHSPPEYRWHDGSALGTNITKWL